MERMLVMALALLLACDAGAQTVQKCVGRDGHARYQSEPCARGERIAEVWDATPDPVEPVQRDAGARPKRRRGPGAPRRVRVHATVAMYEAGAVDACAAARAYRDAAERRAGLSRNYALLSTLQSRVFDACR